MDKSTAQAAVDKFAAELLAELGSDRVEVKVEVQKDDTSYRVGTEVKA